MGDYIGAFIGLGSNLEQPIEQIKAAVAALKKLPGTQYIGDSGLYLSKPLLLEGAQQELQPDYYNAVALLDTRLEPLVLLDYLQVIETNQGRVREHRWAARTLDLDILMMGQKQLDEARLQLPHPGICQREFVLYPLQHLCEKLQQADLQIPGHGMLSEMIKSCSKNDLIYVGEVV
ncbi:MAG: 2-amino-4-hydroxy-6-hydroxymethyldihydropteridine diphosphokinase [Gammaproteobacteria bacterium]|nr:2-amino-4-hydroxy-6-hydroxymethyldihydropteridine diphosphokinase [Gammaproteobacteria bacterium]